MKVSWRRQLGARDAVTVVVSMRGGTDGKQQACRHTAYALEHKSGTGVKVQETQRPDKGRCTSQTRLQQQEPWQSAPGEKQTEAEERKKTLGKHVGQHWGERRRPRRQIEGTRRK